MDEPLSRGGRQRLDLTDQPFGLLVARERLPKLPGTQGERWRCTCACSGETVVRVKDLSSGNTRSCGCMARRARRQAEEPHRAEPGLQAAITAAVHAALAAGVSLRGAAVRRPFDGRASRSTLYRFIRAAVLSYGGAIPAKE